MTKLIATIFKKVTKVMLHTPEVHGSCHVVTGAYGDSIEVMIAPDAESKWLITVKTAGVINTVMFADYIQKGDY